MKTRIISGVVMAIIVAGLLVLSTVFPQAIFIALAVCSGISAYELLYNTGAVKTKEFVAVAAIFMFITPLSGIFPRGTNWFTMYTLVFVGIAIIIALLRHEKIKAADFGFGIGLPIAVAFAFCSLAEIIAAEKVGIYYFIFLFNFASVADMGAYFVGSAIGKHKLAPVISPKKTIEGSIGGMVISLIFTVVFVIVFNRVFDMNFVLWKWLVATPVFVVMGMIGDLTASYIKRSYGIKDYGNLIPGHGGILDRLDSMLLIAPFLNVFIKFVGTNI